MKIVFPTQDMEKGMGSQVYGHFGSAPQFILVDSDLGTCEALGNPDKVHEHGQCQPMAALGGHQVDAVVVGGIGAGALRKLNASGIKIYRAVEGTVMENLDLVKKGVLPVFTIEATCAGHSHGGNCAH